MTADQIHFEMGQLRLLFKLAELTGNDEYLQDAVIRTATLLLNIAGVATPGVVAMAVVLQRAWLAHDTAIRMGRTPLTSVTLAAYDDALACERRIFEEMLTDYAMAELKPTGTDRSGGN